MSQIHNTVFISYRRSVSAYIARSIYNDLKQHGYDVFMDVENIDSGQFDTIILRQIEARAHFLIICTPGTFERVTESGDWLRREIEHAMDKGRNIIPIIANDFRFDDVTKNLLTGKLSELPRYNAVNASHDYFEAAMDRLRTRFLTQLVNVSITTAATADRQVVLTKQPKFERRQPASTDNQLTAEEYAIRGFNNAKNKDWDNVIADYTEVIRLNPQYTNAHYRRGFAYYKKNDFDSAIADYTEAIRLNPQDADLYNNRAVARKAKSDLDGAIADYNEAIRLNPKDANAYHNRGVALEAKNDPDSAIANYNEAIRLNPQDTDAYNGRGVARESKGDLDGAIADYNQAISLNPQDAHVYRNRAFAHEANGNLTNVIDDLQSYLDLGGSEHEMEKVAVEELIRELKAKLGRS